jgi:anti-sigma factor RsiW
MTEQHISAEDLQAYVDRTLGDERSQAILSHLRGCPRCRQSMESMRRMDAALRLMPIEQAGAAFTASVMHSLGLAGSPKKKVALVENLAYVFALMIVLGVMLSVFLWTGVIKTADLTQGQSTIQEYVGAGTTMVAGAVGVLQRWLLEFFPFAFGNGAFRIFLAVLGVTLLLALVDRVAGRYVAQRTR